MPSIRRLAAPRPAATGHADGLGLAAGTWLASGLVLLGLTPLPMHTVSLGWTPLFALVLAPVIMMLARRMFRSAPQCAPATDAWLSPQRLPRHRDVPVRVPVARRMRTQHRRKTPRPALRQA